VYCEKPLSYRIAEGRAMVQAAARHKRVTQMGNLIHAGDNYHRVVEVLRSGVLGQISKTRVWLAADRNAPEGIRSPTDCDPPSGLDYDFWLGPAPLRTFNPNRFTFNFRYFWDYAGGILTDFCCHIVDLVHWAMDVEAPETITATGGRYALRDNGETPDTLEVVYHYAKGFDMVWSQSCASSHGFDGQGLGIMFQGTKGTLVSNYQKFQIFPEKRQQIELPQSACRVRRGTTASGSTRSSHAGRPVATSRMATG
jgi:predicted dehydrogenase